MLEYVLTELATAEKQLEWTADVVSDNYSRTETSLWSDMMQCSRYLQGHKMSEVGPLSSLPTMGAEPLLEVFVASLNRLVDQAHESLAQQRAGVFDQALIKRAFPSQSLYSTTGEKYLGTAW